jgi:hypothetical protein
MASAAASTPSTVGGSTPQSSSSEGGWSTQGAASTGQGASAEPPTPIESAAAAAHRPASLSCGAAAGTGPRAHRGTAAASSGTGQAWVPGAPMEPADRAAFLADTPAQRPVARGKDVAWDAQTAAWSWTPEDTRLISDTWLQVQVRTSSSDPPPYKTIGEAYLQLGKVKELGRETSGPAIQGRDAGRGTDAETVQIRYWDRGLHPQFANLDGVTPREVRLSVYGGNGQADIGYSEWIGAAELVAAAGRSKPPSWEADQVAVEKKRKEHNLKMEQTKAAKERLKRQKQEEDAAKEPERQRKRAEREQREAAAAAAKKVEAEDAPAGTEWVGWDKLPLFEGWEKRAASAQEKAAHRGKTLVFRPSVKQQEFIVVDEEELVELVLGHCAKLPKHAVVDVDRKNLDGFEGGKCFIVGPVRGELSKVKVKPVVAGGTKTINKKDIRHSNKKAKNWGVTSLQKHFKATKPVPFKEWLSGKSVAAAEPEPVAAAQPVAAAAVAAAVAGAPDQPPTPAWTAEHSSAVTAAVPNEAALKSESRRHSIPVFKPPSEPAIKVKPENGSAPIELIAGKPLEEAEANKGTLRNKKVFVGDSTVDLQAGKGLFVAQAIGKNEVISKFEGDVVAPDADLEFKSHVITLEQSNAGRQLDCYSICKQFTESSTLTSPVGCYAAGGNSYFPVTDKSHAGRSLHDVGLAAFANSSSETEFESNCRVEKTKYRGGEATGYLPQAFLIATRALKPGEEVLFEYPVVVEAARDGVAGEDDAPKDNSAAAEATHKRGRDEAQGGAAAEAPTQKLPRLYAPAAAAVAAPAVAAVALAAAPAAVAVAPAQAAAHGGAAAAAGESPGPQPQQPQPQPQPQQQQPQQQQPQPQQQGQHQQQQQQQQGQQQQGQQQQPAGAPVATTVGPPLQPAQGSGGGGMWQAEAERICAERGISLSDLRYFMPEERMAALAEAGLSPLERLRVLAQVPPH